MKTTLFVTAISGSLLFYSCEEQVESAVGFSLTDQRITEADSVYTIQIDLGSAVEGTTTLQLEISGTAGLDADFTVPLNYFRKDLPNGVSMVSSLETSLTSSATLTLQVTSGSRYITVPLHVVDDNFVEPVNERIRLEITDVSNSSEMIRLENSAVLFYLRDNDMPAAPLQIDLSWIPLTGGSINQSNFDLFLIRNAKLGGGAVASYDLVEGVASTNALGYESILLTNDLPDDEYYVLIRYKTGTVATNIELVLSRNQTNVRAGGVISLTDVGKNFYYGPISKTGTSISFRTTTSSEASWINLP
jgi:hypothetical protein